MPAISTDTTLIESISRTISAHVEHWYPAGSHLQSLVPTLRSFRLSTFFVYTIVRPNAPPCRILVKIQHRQGIDNLSEAIETPRLRHSAQREFALLEEIATTLARGERAQDHGFVAVRPLAYLEAFNATVVEELDAVPLRDLLFRLLPRLSYGTASFVSLCQAAGAWLRIFHDEITPRPPICFASDEFLHEIDGYIADIIAAEGGDLSALRAAFAAHAAQLDGTVLARAANHGDFHATNILVTADRQIAVIDIGDGQTNPTLHDVAEMVADLAIRREQSMSFGLWLGPLGAQLSHAFLTGYYGEAPVADRALNLFCARAVLRKWRHRARMIARQKAPIRIAARLATPFFNAYLRKHLRQYLP